MDVDVDVGMESVVRVVDEEGGIVAVLLCMGV